MSANQGSAKGTTPDVGFLGRRGAGLLALSLLIAACSSLSSNVETLVARLPAGFRVNSVYRDVNALLKTDNFTAARQRLEEAGAGSAISADKLRDKDVAAARTVFEE